MYLVIIAALLLLQPVFPQECRQVTVCNETPRDMIKGDKGDTGNAGKAGPEGRKGKTGSKGIKGEKGLQGQSCALGSFGTNLNKKLAGIFRTAQKKLQQKVINDYVLMRFFLCKIVNLKPTFLLIFECNFVDKCGLLFIDLTAT